MGRRSLDVSVKGASEVARCSGEVVGRDSGEFPTHHVGVNGAV